MDAEARLLALRLRLAATGHEGAVAVLARLGVRYAVEYEGGEEESSEDEDPFFTGFRAVKPPARPRRLAHYCVPFECATWLVTRRRVEMRRGMCMVPPRDMVHVATHHFKAVLLRQMAVLRHALVTMSDDENERLGPILARIVAFWQHETMRQGAGSDYSSSRARTRITLKDIDAMARQHFPLCMSHLHRKLRENHHLKYDGRVQYRMFLKGLGLTVQESILFFRSEFVKVIPPAKFDKEYTYHIRHSYGLEGARKDYSPFDCGQIVHGSAPRHGQYHGCPFKHWDSTTLRSELVGCWGLDACVATEIASQAAGGRPQSACQGFFNARHGISYDLVAGSSSVCGAIVQHPNVYVEASYSMTSRLQPGQVAQE